ncbi:MAG: hypothetical protein CFE24_05235 [Flavobacterium sp. BFFFF2]|nr:MAG: hypothetical protein CFE24_05235 [Flavobacterium sp. BFFFF2]
MLKKIDLYILKRYLVTFSTMLLLFVPIGIIIDVSEKINKMVENQAPLDKIALYYIDFTIYFANLLFPIFLFLSIIWFTSKLANNTEIIAILSSGISFQRFLRPYIFGASIVSVVSLLMGFYLVPKASDGFKTFRYTYLIGNGINEMREYKDIYRQISPNEYIYVSTFNGDTKFAFKFCMERFDGNKLTTKVTADRIRWNQKDSTYTLFDCVKRKIRKGNDILEKSTQKDTVIPLDINDLSPVIFKAETLTVGDLRDFIEKERQRGSANISVYEVVLYKKFSIPVSAFILTIIAVAVSSMKRRGGMGMNLALGILIAFSYVFFDKIFGVLAEKSSIPPFTAVWIPNVIFGILAYYLLKHAKR